MMCKSSILIIALAISHNAFAVPSGSARRSPETVWDFSKLLTPSELKIVQSTLVHTRGARCESVALAQSLQTLLPQAQALLEEAQLDAQKRRNLPLSTMEFNCLVEAVKSHDK